MPPRRHRLRSGDLRAPSEELKGVERPKHRLLAGLRSDPLGPGSLDALRGQPGDPALDPVQVFEHLGNRPAVRIHPVVTPPFRDRPDGSDQHGPLRLGVIHQLGQSPVHLSEELGRGL